MNIGEMGAEPIVITASVLGMGGIFVWSARTLLELRDDSRNMRTAIFGNPADSEPNGLKKEVRSINTKLDRHIEVQDGVNEWTAKTLGVLVRNNDVMLSDKESQT